jgi:hypothetical protein
MTVIAMSRTEIDRLSVLQDLTASMSQVWNQPSRALR